MYCAKTDCFNSNNNLERMYIRLMNVLLFCVNKPVLCEFRLNSLIKVRKAHCIPTKAGNDAS